MIGISLFAASLLTAPALGGDGDSNVLVRVVSITESRYKDFSKKSEKKDDSAFGGRFFSSGMSNENTLIVKLELRGKSVAAATHYGNISLQKAALDKGGALALSEIYKIGFADPRTDFVQIDRRMMNFGKPDASEDEIVIDLKFDLPPRHASRLTRLQGSIKLRTGQPREIFIDNISGKTGQALSHKLLQQAGLTVAVGDPSKKKSFFISGEPGKSITLTISGRTESLLDLTLTNAEGEDLYASQMSSSGGGSTMYVLEDDEKLTPGAKLKLTVALGLATVDVPFEFTDVPLP